LIINNERGRIIMAMSIAESAHILELKCYEVIAPKETEDFEALCTEVENDITDAVDVMLLEGREIASASDEDFEATEVWSKSIYAEKRRVVEEIALDWMTADEQWVNFGETCKEE
jgi:hypothetical protein